MLTGRSTNRLDQRDAETEREREKERKLETAKQLRDDTDTGIQACT